MAQLKTKIGAGGPYLRTPDTVLSYGADLLIALLPAVVWGVIVFGWRAAALPAAAVLGALAVRAVTSLLFWHTLLASDIGAAAAGLVCGLCLPVTAPYLAAVLAGGGAALLQVLLGRYSPVYGSPVCLSVLLTGWLFRDSLLPAAPFTRLSVLPLGGVSAEGAEAVFPLDALFAGEMPEEPLYRLFLGDCPGAVGEISALLLLIGFGYLCLRRISDRRMLALYLFAFALTAFLFPVTLNRFESMTAEFCSGCTVLGLFLMACDGRSLPHSARAKTVFGLGCGALALGLRYLTDFADGVFLAVLVMSLLSPLLDLLFAPKPFGGTLKNRKRVIVKSDVEKEISTVPENMGKTSTH